MKIFTILKITFVIVFSINISFLWANYYNLENRVATLEKSGVTIAKMRPLIDHEIDLKKAEADCYKKGGVFEEKSGFRDVPDNGIFWGLSDYYFNDSCTVSKSQTTYY